MGRVTAGAGPRLRRARGEALTYVASGPFQYAVAEALALPDSYVEAFRADMLAFAVQRRWSSRFDFGHGALRFVRHLLLGHDRFVFAMTTVIAAVALVPSPCCSWTVRRRPCWSARPSCW